MTTLVRLQYDYSMTTVRLPYINGMFCWYEPPLDSVSGQQYQQECAADSCARAFTILVTS